MPDRACHARVLWWLAADRCGKNERALCARAGCASERSQAAAYHQITWAKWSLAYYAMHAAESVLLLDADVAVLRNPFTPGLTSRDEDLLYQQEHVGHERTPFTPSHRPEARARGPKRPGVPWALFGSPVNTGQLYVRSRALVERVMRAMPPTADADPRLEQEIVFEDVLQNRSEGWRASGLPDRYAGHCWYEPRRLPWSSCSRTTRTAKTRATPRSSGCALQSKRRRALSPRRPPARA